MIHKLKSMFALPSAEELAIRQRAQTERELLSSEADLEEKRAMRDMLKQRLVRLQAVCAMNAATPPQTTQEQPQ